MKFKSLTPEQAKGSIANKLIGVVDRARQIAVRIGVRPYKVHLVWTHFGGRERGEGHEKIVCRCEVLPTPRVSSLDAIAFNPYAAGELPVGSIKVDRISGRFSADTLRGLQIPERHEDDVPEPYDFFWEVVEDGRGDPQPVRERYRVLSEPFRHAAAAEWTIMLKRASQDRTRDDRSPFE